jgi:hypothetical protein
VRLSVAHSGSYGGSRMTRGCATSYTAVRGTTISSASVRPYGFFLIPLPSPFSKFFYGGRGIYIPITGKDTPTHRLTHILRPNATRPDPATRAALATPPVTDGDFSSHSPYDSDALPSSLSDVQSIDDGLDVPSESDFASEPEFGSAHGRGQRHGPVEIAPLSDIASDLDADVEVGSVQGTGGGSDGDGNAGDFNLEQATGELSLASDDETPRRLPLRGTAYRDRAWTAMWDAHQRARSGSSPSRSPARRKPRWPLGRTMVKKSVGSNNGGKTESFYDFLFK